MNVGPVPGGPATDRPARLGKHTALPPLVNGNAGHPQLLGDLGQAHGLAILHGKNRTESLDTALVRTDNQYMTQTENSTKTAPCGCTFQGRIYSLLGCTVIDIKTATGTQMVRHAMAQQKKAK